MNWSLNLHIRLRTISILIPTHITHVYVQWMSYSFVWLRLIKCVSHTQFLLIKHKKIFECFNCFWKVFCFWKNIKNFKNSVALFWRFDRGSIQSHALNRELTQMGFTTLWWVNVLVAKNDLEIFSKFWVFKILVTMFGDLFASGSFSREFIQKFSRLPSRLTREWTFQSWKTLRNLFKNFVSKVFGDLSWQLVRNLVQSWKMRVLRFRDSF